MADRVGYAPTHSILEIKSSTRTSTTNIHQAVLAFNLLHHGRVIELTRCRTLNPNLLDENVSIRRGTAFTRQPLVVLPEPLSTVVSAMPLERPFGGLKFNRSRIFQLEVSCIDISDH